MENILSNYEVIEEPSGAADTVHPGSKVRVLDLEDNSEEEYQLVGSQEADPYQRRISDESPFGKALYGAKLGETVVVDAPAGPLKYKVLEIK